MFLELVPFSPSIWALFIIGTFILVFLVVRIIVYIGGLVKELFAKKVKTAAPEVIVALDETQEADAGPYLSAGTLRLKDCDEQTAAMIMAIVSDESQIPLNELIFKSIKLVPDKKS